MMAPRKRDDSGFTLVELLVYSVLMIIVLGIAASLFIRLLVEQRDIKAMADANNEAQLAFKQLEMDVRNADWAQVDGNGALLVVRTRIATSASDFAPVCVGYYFDDEDQTLYRVQTVDSAPTANALAAPDASALKAIGEKWTPVVHSADSLGGNVVFGPLDGLFSTPDTIWVSMAANANDVHKPIELEKSIGLRKQTGLGSGCQ
jgi:type II secretory pathway pseudopilin PulG